ncbi:MAG: hypothetical protein NVS4B12_19590 [Ktedonobacteraceae bacterium]
MTRKISIKSRWTTYKIEWKSVKTYYKSDAESDASSDADSDADSDASSDAKKGGE